MSDFLTDDAMCTQHGQRNQAEDDRWAQQQLAGIAALIALARRLERDGSVGPEAHEGPAPGHDTLVGLPPVLEQRHEEPRLSAEPVHCSAAATAAAAAQQIKHLSAGQAAEVTRGIVAVLSVVRDRVHQYGKRRRA